MTQEKVIDREEKEDKRGDGDDDKAVPMVVLASQYCTPGL
jgi:hypothetical protein